MLKGLRRFLNILIDYINVQTLFIERDILPSFASELNGWAKYYDSVKSRNIHTIDTYIKYSTSLEKEIK